MKKKTILTAMALPALLVACSKERLATPDRTAEGLKGRRVVENVTLTFTRDEDPATRLEFDGNRYTFEEGDKVGALLVDDITGTYTDYESPWTTRFALKDFIQTNYPFVRYADESWRTEAKLTEGNYFFVYPYDKKQGVRESYRFELGAQTINGGTMENVQEAYKDNQAWLGFSKVAKGDGDRESLKDIKMTSIFGGTGITLVNTGTNEYEVTKLVLRGTKVKSAAVLDPTFTTAALQYSGDVFTAGSATNPFIKGTDGTAPTNHTDAKGTYNATDHKGGSGDNSVWFNPDQATGEGTLHDPAFADYGNGAAALRDAVREAETAAPIEVAVSNVRLKSQQSAVLVVMSLPVDDITAAGSAILDIYTDKGRIEGIDLSKRYQTLGAPAGTSGEGVNVLTDKALTALGKSGTNGKAAVEITFDDTSIDRPEAMRVSNGDDLSALIRWNAAVNKNVTAVLQQNVTFTKEHYNALMASDILALTVVDEGSSTHTLTLAEDVPADVLGKLKFGDAGTTPGLGSSVTLAAISKVVIKNAVDLTEDEANATFEVAEGGTLAVKRKLTVTEKITNKGTLTVEADLTASGSIDNYGEATVTATGIVSSITNKEGGVLTNYGSIATLTDNEAATTPGAAPGTVWNHKNISAVTQNNGVIHNSVKDATNREAQMNITSNKGVVYANALSGTNIGTNDTDGVVDVTDLTTSGTTKGNLKITTKTGKVRQRVSGEQDIQSLKTADVNLVWLEGGGTLTAGAGPVDMTGGGKTLDIVVKAGTEESVAKTVIKGTPTTALTVSGITIERFCDLTVDTMLSLTAATFAFETTDNNTKVDADHPSTLTINQTVGSASNAPTHTPASGQYVWNYAQ